MASYVVTFNVVDENAQHLHSISFDPRDSVGSPSVVNSPFTYTYATAGTVYPTVQVPGYIGKVGSIVVPGDGSTTYSIVLSVPASLHGIYDNMYMDQPVYSSNNVLTSARIRIYSNSGNVGTDNDVIATYTMTATETAGRVLTYKTVKTG